MTTYSNIIDAIRGNDVATIITITSNPSNLSILDQPNHPSEWTPLMLAASKGRVEIVQALLEAGVDASYVTSQGCTAWSLVRSPMWLANTIRHFIGSYAPGGPGYLLDRGRHACRYPISVSIPLKAPLQRYMFAKGWFGATIDANGQRLIPAFFHPKLDCIIQQRLISLNNPLLDFP